METTIKSGLRTIGLRFDAHAVLYVCEMHGVDIGDLDKIGDEYYPSYVWCAYRSYQTYRNRRYRLSYKRMKHILAKMRVSEYTKMNEAMAKAAAPADKEAKGNKKKAHGKTSSSQDTGQA